MVLDILEKYFVSRLKFIRQLSVSSWKIFQRGEGDTGCLDVLKQPADYDISAQTLKKML